MDTQTINDKQTLPRPEKKLVTRKRRTLFIIAALVPSLVVLLLLELALRWQLKGDSFFNASVTVHKKSDDATMVYEMVPNSETTRAGVRIKINSAGFRDDEFPTPGLRTGRRIVLLGDSVAWGWGVPMEAAFPQLLETQLREQNPPGELPPHVYNLAVDGYSTEQELAMLKRRGLEFRPDLVIINYVLNDPDNADGGLARYYKSEIMLWNLARRAWKRFVWIASGNWNRDEFHQRVHALHEKEISDRFRQLGRLSEEHDLPILIVVTPVFLFEPGEPYRWQNIHDSIQGYCEQNGLQFLDVTDRFRGESASVYSLDRWHPNENGHAAIAQALAEYLQENWPK